MNRKSILTSFIVMFLYGGLYFASYNQNRRTDTTDQAISVNDIKGDYQYLSLSDLKQILNLQDHDAQAIQRILTEINPQWAFQGEDTGEIFFSIKNSDNNNQLLDWHKSEQQLEYIILNLQGFLSITNQIQNSGLKLVKSAVIQYETDKVYMNNYLIVGTAKVKLTSSGRFTYKIVLNIK